jgi:DNA helicase HerA-like ATPase
MTSSPNHQAADKARLEAFCDGHRPEVFGAIVHGSMIWKPDPFDVESIHADARLAFSQLLHKAAAPAATGKSLLLLGDAGSGKTHLMRAFRNEAHSSRAGYCGYLQMTARADNYARYVLSNLIDALEQPYQHPQPLTGFGRLARGLIDRLDVVSEEERRILCDEIVDPAQLAGHVHHICDFVVQYPEFQGVDLDLIRAILYLLSHDGRIRPRVLKWLRCENLSRADSEMLGDLEPRPQDEMPLRTIVGLGRLMGILHQAALVLCVDQLEETIDQLPKEGEETRWHFLRQAINVLIDIADACPNAVVVVACLADLFEAGRHHLPMPKLDRLQRDPEPVCLQSKRSLDEISSMLGRRLAFLYDEMDEGSTSEETIFPFRREHLQPLGNLRTRDVLDHFRQHHERCIRAGTWVEPDGFAPLQETAKAMPLLLEQAWNDALSTFEMPTLDDEVQVTELLGWAIAAVSAEMPPGTRFDVQPTRPDLNVEVHRPGNATDKLLLAVCNRKAQGGGLEKQLTALAQRAGETRVVVARTAPFPSNPTTNIAKQIAMLMEPKGRWWRQEIQSSDLRHLAAFRQFHAEHNADGDFAAWQFDRRPLSGIKAIGGILGLDQLQEQPALVVEKPPSVPPAAKTVVPPPKIAPVRVVDGTLQLGATRGMSANPVAVPIRDMTQHAAFLGGSGSGKTTAALCLIEQLLDQGVPVVLLDRKGDLCRYADPAAWNMPSTVDPEGSRRAELRAKIEIALFTPNNAQGRPLTLGLTPPGMRLLPSADREQIAQSAASGLARMMGYGRKPNDPKQAILAKAIEVLGSLSEEKVTLSQVKKLISDRDDALCSELEAFEDRHYKKLGEDLLTLTLRHNRLLDDPAAEELDLNLLLGLGQFARAGKTQLTIVSTQFLTDAAVIDFWVAQFLVAIDEWSRKHPATDRLQAVFLFDEADQYLPAVRQPATKAPMENLLRRARSRGIGLMLATQSPGDLDYKCRDQIKTWLIGRIKEKVSIDKLRPMLEAAPGDIASRLPGQSTGEFYLAREKEIVAIKTKQSLIATAQVAEDRIAELARHTKG